MTKTTEELKREMYGRLAAFRIHAVMLDTFEESLEAYLDRLHQDLKTSHVATGDLAILLHEAKTERDQLRNKLQAFEFANKNAGELLRDALATVKRQRKFIMTLYTSRKARKVKGSTSAQSLKEVSPESICGALLVHSQPACQHSWMKKIDYPSGALSSQCIFCMKIQEC